MVTRHGWSQGGYVESGIGSGDRVDHKVGSVMHERKEKT